MHCSLCRGQNQSNHPLSGVPTKILVIILSELEQHLLLMVILTLLMLSQSGDAGVSVQSPQSSTELQSAGVNDDDEMQSDDLKQTEMKLIRQIESIQKERSLFHSDIHLLSYAFVIHVKMQSLGVLVQYK